MGWKVLWVPDLAAFLEKGKVSEQLLWQPKWPQHVPGHFESLTLPFITKENPCIIHKICCQEKFLIAPLPAGMNAENFQLLTCMVLEHFITISWKKRELQSMDNVQVKYFRNLLPSDIHRQKSQWLNLMIKMSLVLYQIGLRRMSWIH